LICVSCPAFGFFRCPGFIPADSAAGSGYRCRWHTIKISAAGPHREPYHIRYDNLNIGQGRFYQARPVNFAIYNGSGRAVFEIDNVQLKDDQGNNLIKNGSFSKGSHFWFFSRYYFDMRESAVRGLVPAGL